MDSDGNLMMRMGDHMAMDMDTGDIHMISSWSDAVSYTHLDVYKRQAMDYTRLFAEPFLTIRSRAEGLYHMIRHIIWRDVYKRQA